MQRKNWWVPMVATVAIFSLVDVSLGDDDENPSNVKSKDNQSKSEFRDEWHCWVFSCAHSLY